MAVLTPVQFKTKYQALFADNEFENITEATFRELSEDCADSFGAGSKPFDADWLVVTDTPFGKYLKGQMVPAKDKDSNAVLLDAWSGSILPSYTNPSLSVVQTAPATGEEGENVSNTVTGTYAPGDAGAASATRLYKNGVEVAADVDGSVSFTENVVRPLGSVLYKMQADYAAGAPKPVKPANTPDTRAAAVRSVNAPQAAATGFESGNLSLNGQQKLFFGPKSTAVATSADVRSLANGNSGWVYVPYFPANAGIGTTIQVILATGTAAKNFVGAAPAGWVLDTAVDTTNQGANVRPFYVLLTGLTQVNNAAAEARAYNVYQMSQTVPYGVSANHVLTFKKTS
ncbi:hypothetical protein GCM10027346_20910 [Hymenobacter seoulensis]